MGRVDGLGSGLKAEYFNNMRLSGEPVLNRIDPTVDFNWAYGGPGGSIGQDKFSARWQGQIEAPVSGNYVFTTLGDDGVRVWIDDVLIINDWQSHKVTRNSANPLRLKAGRRYKIKVDYCENGSTASIQLLWSYPGQDTSQTVPTKYLYPNSVAPPENVAAAGYWDDTTMARVELAWQPAPEALTYNIYRNGALYTTGLTGTSFKDVEVQSGRVYGYTVTAVGALGESNWSVPAVADAPYAPYDSGAKVPVNLRVVGTRTKDTNRAADFVYWDSVAGATSYNLYLYDVLVASGLKDTQYAISSKQFFRGLTYTVTAVTGPANAESIPSNIATSQGLLPDDSDNDTAIPLIPTHVTATPEWNAGAPRVVLAWRSRSNNATYNVYRDSTLIASGVWGLTYMDQNVLPGERHTYTVTGVPWGERTASLPSLPLTATALTSDVTPRVVPLQITRVVTNDDSVMVFFLAVPGAKDYRVYSPHNPGVQKYSGGGLSVEMNAINPDEGSDLIVEAVDKLGPFQKMDGQMGPGGMHAQTGEVNMIINGMGDPSNAPNVIARSTVFHVNCQPRVLTGEQVFFDTFRDSKPFLPVEVPLAIVKGIPAGIRGVANDKWTIYNYAGDFTNSRIFAMSSHFMDTLYDGGTPGGPIPLHNNNASLVMSPKATADVSGGQVLHVTFEVDAHFDARRWCDLVVTAADDLLLQPAKLDGGLSPTASGNMFRWEIKPEQHVPMVFSRVGGDLVRTLLDTPDRRSLRTVRGQMLSNGSKQDLDKRHRFDLYLSQKRFVLMEEGKIVQDTTFPKGSELPFSQMQVHFVHQVYHTGNDRPELMNFDPEETYWINHRPWADERHWDNMGFEVVKKFP